MIELFDTHFHFYGENTPLEYRRRIEETLNAPAQREALPVDRLLLLAVGGDYVESCRAREFAQYGDDVWFAAGVHPHQAEAYLHGSGEDFSIFRGHPRLAAIGELGLDYFYDHSPREIQRQVFARFLELALEWELPAVIHIRDREECCDAYADAFELLEGFAGRGGRFVVHCFAGSPEWAERFLSLGGYCGVNGLVTFRRAENVRETLRVIPDDRLLLETDSPYLAPVPHRGVENLPGYLGLIAVRVAEERNMTPVELAEMTTGNGRRFFRIPGKGAADE